MEVSDQIIKVLDYICEKIGITIDWTSNNVIPQVQMMCEHYIQYELWTSIIWLIFLIAGTLICVFTTYKLIKNEWDLVTVALPIAIGLFLLPFCFIQINDIIKCLTFPELQCYEYFSRVLRQLTVR